mmetsp:Transcript_42061/g.80455  ORF Transcript_42061/g.80455 Transcript_42061/m.80455 type:complete len:245 (+) Transcript_42061:1217-1951(+)
MARVASCWPITRPVRASSSPISTPLSEVLSFCMGMPVHCATTSATCSSPTFREAPSCSKLANWTMAPASSMRSIALSGKKRSLIYLTEYLTEASRDSGVYTTSWCSSYVCFSPFRIDTVCSGVGSSILTGWNLRSSAASFSTYLRYSSMVVAPMHCSSPRASTGFISCAASMPPSAPADPAPMSVCSSSMNKMMSLFFITSSRTCFRRSSNSPRYLVSATSRPSCSESRRLPRRLRGTLPSTMR